MIIINKKYKLNPDGSGHYDLLEVKIPKFDPKNPTKELIEYDSTIGYSMSLDSALNKIIHLIGGETIEKNDIPLMDYIKLLGATSVKINKILTEKLKKND